MISSGIILSERELQIADLIHQGLIEKEIADKLFISQHTVHTHLRNIREKLHARNIADITRIFLLDLSKATRVAGMIFFLVLQTMIIYLETDEMIRANRTRVPARREIREGRTRRNEY